MPVAALLVTAFTEDTGLGFGAFTLRQFRRGLCLDAHPAPVRQLGRLCARHRGRDLFHRRLRRLGGRAHRRAGPHAVSQSGAAVVRRSGPADGDGVDFRAQPQYRLGQCGCEIRIPPEQRAGQYLHHGRHDLGAVEPLFSAGLSRHRAGAARARRAHGGGRPDVRRPLLARAAEDHAAAVAPGHTLRPAAALHHGHVFLRSAAPDRPAGAHRRLHHGNPERHLKRAAGIRHRQRAEPDPAADLHRRGLFLSPRHPQRRSLRHHHRQGLQADPHRARPLALAGGGRHRIHVPDRARAAAVHARLAVVLPQPVAAVHGLAGAGDLGELSLHPQLSGVPQRGAHQRRRLRHGGEHSWSRSPW